MFDFIESASDKTVANAKELYNYIRLYEPISKASLQQLTGYKLTTLVRAINWLVEAKLIYGIEVGESTGGRKPVLYNINPNSGFIIGVDICRTYTKVALMDFGCNIIKSLSFGMFVENTPESTIRRICDLIKELSLGIDINKILGIGVGAVGPLNKEEGTMLNPVNFPAKGWENVSIKQELERSTRLLTIMENGANAAAYGEYKKGIGREYNSLVYISSGVGLRLGVIFNGKIVENTTVNEEGFGHVIVDIFGKECTCGNKGCLGAYTTIPEILKAFIDDIKKGRYSSALQRVDFDLSAINFDVFSEAVKNNDELAVETVNKSAEYFSVGLMNLINILNPELIILGGPLLVKCDLFYNKSTELAQKKISRTSPSVINFQRGALGDNAVVIGCGNIVLDYFFR